MGHDLPIPLWPLLTGAIIGFTAAAIDSTIGAGRAGDEPAMVAGVD